jgi:valyl-tRNA synthetase
MIELDQMNAEKRALSQQLLDKIKFVRSLQAELGTADNGDINEMIDKDLEESFKKEKHLNVQLKEKLKECEMEKLQIIEQLDLLEAKQEVTVVTKTENHVDLDKSMMNINELINYRRTVI